MYKNKKQGLTGSIIIFIILIILVFTSNIGINNFSKVENIFNKIVMPVQNGLTYLKNRIAKNSSFFESIDALKTENEELKKTNQELQTKLEELEIIKAENSVLREYANLVEQYSEYETIPAYIINKDTSNFSNVFVINVGTKNGVYANMAVMGKEGVIGYVRSATSSTAKVQPIIASGSSISGLTTSTRKNVLIKGQLDSSKELKVNSLQLDTDLVIGDTIETSGLGGIYPKGIKIGTITKLVETKNKSEDYAILETTVDFESLEYVLIIKK